MDLVLPNEWAAHLSEELNKTYLVELEKFIDSERRLGKTIFPKEEHIFRSFLKTPFDRVSVVIMGQDPYHGDGQAEGLSFSVQKGMKIPPSLKNIYKELQQDLGVPIASYGCLEKWAEQGVLLLNATLTVEKNKPLSHHKRGWEQFTDAVVRVLLQHKKHLVFLLWGKNAQEKILSHPALKEKDHCVLTAAHPSPFSATGFFGCRHFSKTNEYLLQHGKKSIDWAIT